MGDEVGKVPEDLRDIYEWALEEIHTALCDERPCVTAKNIRNLVQLIAKDEAAIAELTKPVTDGEWAFYHGWIVWQDEDTGEKHREDECMNRAELNRFLAARASGVSK